MNGGASVVFPVSLTSDANSIETVSQIREVLADAEKRFPADMKLTVIQDNTQFITESLNKVAHTFFEALVLVIFVIFMFLGSWRATEKVAHTFVEALVLVIFVIFIFLGSWRATLIPLLAVPVSLVGTFASFVLLGFTINTLTAFALILAMRV